MITLTISDSLTLTLYDSIQSLPADRYQAARRYEIMAKELPTSEESEQALLSLADKFAAIGDTESANNARYNAGLGHSLAAEQFYPACVQFGLLVASENNKKLTGYSEDELVRYLADWVAIGLTTDQIDQTLSTAWENIQRDLSLYFPKRYGHRRQMNSMDTYKRMLVCQLDHAIQNTEASKLAYEKAVEAVLSNQKPARFAGDNPITLDMEKGWGRLQVMLAESGCSDPHGLTVFDMYTWLDNIEEKLEAQKSSLRNANKR